MKRYEIVVVGAGISGSVIAERFASIGKKVLLIEKRNHIGGNCFDYINDVGILIPMYGCHIFHTNDEEVWKYINNFSEWIHYEHKVLSFVDGKYVPIPVNITTVNKLFGLNIENEDKMKEWLNKNIEKIDNPKNSEESALSRVGSALYEKMFKPYTKKQWDLWPSELDAEIMNRIPVRTNFDDRYFSDKYQAMPKNGYTKMFENMLNNKNIELRLNTNWDDIKYSIEFDKLFFTGPIDQFFSYKFGGKLEYRSLSFEFQTIERDFFQKTTTVNFPSLDFLYTRITEPKHSTGQKNKKTTIIREYAKWGGEPYYPVLNEKNKKLYKRYEYEAIKLESDGVYFVGRLANYKYFDMDKAIKNALNIYRL